MYIYSQQIKGNSNKKLNINVMLSFGPPLDAMEELELGHGSTKYLLALHIPNIT